MTTYLKKKDLVFEVPPQIRIPECDTIFPPMRLAKPTEL